MVVGMMISSFCSQYWQLLLTEGLAVGVGAGCLYLPGVSIISQYFKKEEGTYIRSSDAFFTRFLELMYMP